MRRHTTRAPHALGSRLYLRSNCRVKVVPVFVCTSSAYPVNIVKARLAIRATCTLGNAGITSTRCDSRNAVFFRYACSVRVRQGKRTVVLTVTATCACGADDKYQNKKDDEQPRHYIRGSDSVYIPFLSTYAYNMNTILSSSTGRSQLQVGTFTHHAVVDACVVEASTRLINYPEIMLFGKKCRQRRCIGFFSDTSMGYKYSGQLAKSQPLTSSMKAMLRTINDMFKSEFNGILVNKYYTGEDYISAHSDDETALDRTVGVVSVSYGAVRKFRIRDKKTRQRVLDVPTTPYTIMAMCGDFQKEYTHEIPKEKKVKGWRMSFTFRRHKQ